MVCLKNDYTALHNHYEIREARYKEKIESLQQALATRDLQIKDLTEQLQLSNSTVKRLNEQINRMIQYGNCSYDSNNTHKKKFPFFWK